MIVKVFDRDLIAVTFLDALAVIRAVLGHGLHHVLVECRSIADRVVLVPILWLGRTVGLSCRLCAEGFIRWNPSSTNKI